MLQSRACVWPCRLPPVTSSTPSEPPEACRRLGMLLRLLLPPPRPMPVASPSGKATARVPRLLGWKAATSVRRAASGQGGWYNDAGMNNAARLPMWLLHPASHFASAPQSCHAHPHPSSPSLARPAHQRKWRPRRLCPARAAAAAAPGTWPLVRGRRPLRTAPAAGSVACQGGGRWSAAGGRREARERGFQRGCRDGGGRQTRREWSPRWLRRRWALAAAAPPKPCLLPQSLHCWLLSIGLRSTSSVQGGDACTQGQ